MSHDQSRLPVPKSPLDIPAPAPGEATLSREFLPRSPRLIVYGNVMSGAMDLVSEMRDTLVSHNRIDLDVFGSKNIARIEYSFFFGKGLPLEPKSQDSRAAIGPETPALTGGEENQKPGMLRRAGNILVRKGQSNAEQTPEAPRAPTLPTAVMIFPEMRAYDPTYGAIGRTVDTPYERIEDLCTQYGVPFVYVQNYEPGELARKIDELIPQIPELPPAE